MDGIKIEVKTIVIILLTGLSIFAIQNSAYGQNISTIINQTSKLIKTVTTNVNLNYIIQVLQELEKRVATLSRQDIANNAINKISAEVASDPHKGEVSSSITYLANKLASNPDRVHLTLANIAQTITKGPPPQNYIVIAIMRETEDLIGGYISQFTLSSASSIKAGNEQNRGVSGIEDSNFVIKIVFSSGIPLDSIERTLGHLIIQTANYGGDSVAQRVALQIAEGVRNSPSGGISHSMYEVATFKSNGHITLANEIIDALARFLGAGGNISEMPKIVQRFIQPIHPTPIHPTPIHPTPPDCTKNPKDPRCPQPPDCTENPKDPRCPQPPGGGFGPCTPGYVKNSDNYCVKEPATILQSPPRCPDGSIQAADGTCPSPPLPTEQQTTCPDGSQPAADGTCPTPTTRQPQPPTVY
ncbi:MAG TPA: hypothetical protein VFI70_11935 [Nitrososphaeraceae archaeon]|nr:hypothetical protein [Nitrososphaeraceae archaeon]